MRNSGLQRPWWILALACLVAAVYWPSAAVLVAQWCDFTNITYTHGWLILAVCAWLVYRRRAALAAAPAAPWPLAQAGLLAASFLWLVCYRAGLQDLHILVFPALFWLAAAAAFGARVAAVLFFPAAFFVFALPAWGELATPLQSLTVSVMGAVLELTGPQASIRGAFIHIPNGSFVIEQGCSGLHFMIVGLAVAALHGELRGDPWRTRLIQLAVMAALALLANWVRVYTVIEAGYLTDMKHHLVSVGHYWFGWCVFAVALAAFFWLSTWFSPALPPAAAPGGPPQAGQGRAVPGEAAGFVLAAILLVLPPGLGAALRQRSTAVAPQAAAHLQPAGGWSYAQGSFGSFWMPAFGGADDSLHTVLTGPDGRTVEVFAVGYREQRQDAELVGESASLLGPHLKFLGERIVSSPAGEFIETEVADPEQAHSLIWSRYEIGERRFVRRLASQLWFGLTATAGHAPSVLVAARGECAGDCSAARAQLSALAASGTLR
jgi:exosortase